MISNSRDKDFASKQENGLDTGQNTKRLCTSKACSLLKDPRIVRVSRSFGKKDRHSKVSTIRGLRDRRVRLSVPTAIQLYNLQERLGLNQPSKVVDWLLNAAQHEINVLPPLQMLQENSIQYPQLIPTSHANQHQDPSTSLLDTNLDCFKDRGSHSLNLFSNEVNEKRKSVVIEEEQSILPKPTYWNSDGNLTAKSKDASREMGFDKSNWSKRFGQENPDANHVHSSQTLSHNPFSLLNHSSHLSLVNTAIPYNPFYDREPSNVAMSQSGANEYSSQIEELHKFNTIPIPSSLSLSSGSQLLLYQSITTPSTLLPYISNPLECDSKQVSYSQVLSLNSQNAMPPSLVTSLYSISPTMRQFQVNMNHNNQHHQNNQAITWHKGSSGSIDAFGSNDSKLVLGSNASSTHVWICRSNEEHLD